VEKKKTGNRRIPDSVRTIKKKKSSGVTLNHAGKKTALSPSKKQTKKKSPSPRQTEKRKKATYEDPWMGKKKKKKKKKNNRDQFPQLSGEKEERKK